MSFEVVLSFLTLPQVMMAFGIALVAGFVKGATGFAMPMIMISGLGSFLSPELALAGLIFSTVASNVWQSLRGGVGEAVEAFKLYRLYIAALLVMILLSAQLVVILPQSVVFLTLGIIVVLLASYLLIGRALHIPDHHRAYYDLGLGSISGVIGGVAGIWGPLTVAYLTAVDTPKKLQIKITGVIFGMGSLTLLIAHLRSGVLNAQTIPLSVGLMVPALFGMLLGNLVQDRLDQKKFKRATLFVLLIAGANLIRRGLA
ncbi:sulfite exporter TauE/SafE family protein [Celeribacter litoreus]|uniref:sulfite exporter TauE/SafE family protein n=1 Tax=Celeribacter litoreus TaxID=2876714 RepID=UPI001CCD78A8|nr:sulfite exporter TauE/SafE family protein [Celeribacter litoreus]MCA0042372.1 sulfite exporter TauE/SafE family protein [Celeribacter litoreus]